MSQQTVKQKIKNGGPYTKKEQEERKIQVYHLHFEENKSAVKIAELLNVNRNTINDDIRYWHLQFSNEIKSQNLTGMITKQIQRMEIQRDRLFDYLEDAENSDETLHIEKFISDIDNRLAQLCSKMISSGRTCLEPTERPEEKKEDKMKEFVKDLILSDEDPDSEYIYSNEKLQFDYIKRAKCSVQDAEFLLDEMLDNGLDYFEKSSYIRTESSGLSGDDKSPHYDLAEFANLRGYITNDEFESLKKKRLILRKKREEEHIQKYGSDKSKWPKEVKEMYENDEDSE